MSSLDHPKPDAIEPDAKKQKTGDDMSSSAVKYSLYSYWRSGASWRVRIAMAFKGLKYEYIPINLLKSEQQTEEYSKKNPQRKIPLLTFGENKSISQSLAIIDYLDNAHPETPALFPKDPYLRAKAWSLAEGVNADIQPLQNLPALTRVKEIAGEEAQKEWGKYFISRGLKAFEENVLQVGGKYCLGDNITIADVCLVPQLSAARRFNIDLQQFPTLLRIEKEVATHPAFIAGHANAQPDKPAEMGPIE